MSTVYINQDTNSIIDSSYIVSNDDHGIIVNKNNCWQLIPNKSIRTEDNDNTYYRKNPQPSLSNKQVSGLIRNNAYDAPHTEIVRQEFGFENFKVFTRYPQESSGLISKPISIKNVAYFKITADIINAEHGSIEISILDGTNKIPILLEGKKHVFREKLFYGFPLRFQTDTLQGGAPVLYKNGSVIDVDYTTLSAEDMMSNTYWVNYTAAGNVDTYYPSGQDIRIKVVIRQYDQEPVSIENLAIHKFGETIGWTLKTSD